jgi:phage-related protein
MSKLSTAITATAILFAVVLAGCGSDTVSEIADGGAKTAACSAISSLQGKVGDLENASPEELDKLKTQVSSLQKAIDGLGSNLPDGVATEVDDATSKLNDAIDSAQSDAAGGKDKLKSAADDVNSSLDDAAKKIGC